ncbi:hypothetical protein GGR56DRAFT_635381 [Xylariaceae sp. FL0804]|nr:hypothetical protein GGR56DRAFT_635381 [Xylariaceae sp. FL0804]
MNGRIRQWDGLTVLRPAMRDSGGNAPEHGLTAHPEPTTTSASEASNSARCPTRAVKPHSRRNGKPHGSCQRGAKLHGPSCLGCICKNTYRSGKLSPVYPYAPLPSPIMPLTDAQKQRDKRDRDREKWRIKALEEAAASNGSIRILPEVTRFPAASSLKSFREQSGEPSGLQNGNPHDGAGGPAPTSRRRSRVPEGWEDARDGLGALVSLPTQN